MDINYINKLNRNPLMEYLLAQNFTREANILKSIDIDGKLFLNFTLQDLAEWRLNAYQKKLILNCRNKILRKSLISDSTLSVKPNLEREHLEQNKALYNFTSESYKKETPNTLGTQRPLPGPASKEISTYKNIDSIYNVPAAIPKLVAIKPGLENEKFTLDEKILGATKEQNRNNTPTSTWSSYPPLSKESGFGKSVDGIYDVPAAILRPYVPINPNVKKEQFQQTVKVALESSSNGKQNTLERQPTTPKKKPSDQSTDYQYEEPMVTPIQTTNPHMDKEQFKAFKNTLQALQQTPRGKPHTHEKAIPLPVVSKESRSDKTINIPVTSTILKHTVPVSPIQKKEKFQQELHAALQSNKKGKSNILRSQNPLPSPVKEMSPDKSGNSHYDVPKELAKSKPNLPINSKVETEQLQQTRKTVNTLKSSKEGKPNTLGNQRMLPTLPKAIVYDNSIDDEYEVPTIIPNQSISINTNMKRLKFKESKSKIRDASLKSQKFGIHRPLPALPKNIDSHNSVDHDTSQSLWYVDMDKGNSKTEDTDDDEYINMDLNIPLQPVLSQNNLYKTSTSKEEGNLNLKQPLSGQAASLVQKPEARPRFRLHQVQNADVNKTDDHLLPNSIDVPDFGSSDRSRSPLLVGQGATRIHPQKTGNTCPRLPDLPSKTIPFTVSYEEDENYETLPEHKSKLPVKGSIQDMPLPLIPTRSPAPKTNIPGWKTVENWNETQPEPWDVDIMTDLPPPPPPSELFNFSHFSNDQEKASSLVDQTELPRPPKLSIDEDQISRLKDFFDEVDTPSSDEELFNPNDYIYYRNTDRKGARELLEAVKNLKSDTFVLRPSTKKSYFLGLTIFHNDHYYNLGIYRDSNGKFYGQSLNEKDTAKFDMVESLIEYYKYNPLVVKKRDGRIAELYLKHFLPANIF